MTATAANIFTALDAHRDDNATVDDIVRVALHDLTAAGFVVTEQTRLDARYMAHDVL